MACSTQEAIFLCRTAHDE